MEATALPHTESEVYTEFDEVTTLLPAQSQATTLPPTESEETTLPTTESEVTTIAPH